MAPFRARHSSIAVDTKATGALRSLLAFNMKRLRQRKGWSQYDLAHEAGLSRTYVTDLERAARNCGIDNVERLALTFDVDPIELLLPRRPDRSEGS